MAYPQFDQVPNHYAGPTIQRVKDYRLKNGKRSLCPTLLQIGQLQVLIPRHFGFCFGVERAIHMAFSAVKENPDRNAYLVSEIIHNPLVNNDLKKQGVRFIYDHEGDRQVSEEELSSDDIALIPAFGTTMQVEDSLRQSGIDIESDEYRENYDTTCPFVSKVWKRGEELGRQGYTIIIHGKYNHEETQATHSHTEEHTKTLVVLDAAEAEKVAAYITGEMPLADFERTFAGKSSEDFDPQKDLERVAVGQPDDHARRGNAGSGRHFAPRHAPALWRGKPRLPLRRHQRHPVLRHPPKPERHAHAAKLRCRFGADRRRL